MAFSKEVTDQVVAKAKERGIEPAALLAVVEVESNGKASSPVNGKDMPLILYEYHVFYRYRDLTDDQRALAVKQGLASKSWGQLPYAGNQTQRYDQVRRAALINEQAAYAACSWGVGQVLGENAEWLGYASPKALAEVAMSGVTGQVEVMLRFIDKRGLKDELINHDWNGFARSYNGAGQVDIYGPRIAKAYAAHLKDATATATAPPPAPAALTTHGGVTLRMGMKGEAVAQMQRRLRGLGYHLTVDGDFGMATRTQLIRFQAEHHLTADGIAGPLTLARFEALGGLGR